MGIIGALEQFGDGVVDVRGRKVTDEDRVADRVSAHGVDTIDVVKRGRQPT